uniref:Spectrin repeat containing nuclear envelope protein 2 n=1 Tax=Cyanistes caeruleus TaxID=156563 RepID=A0A8C0UZ05_CYACU
VSDLYTDIQQGHLLLDLLEVLSGQHLPREKGFNTFQCRSNIENALTFLKSRSLKLINIHVADIIEGKPSIVLGLIWTIIFHFHIEELARTLACTYNQPSPDCSSAIDSSTKASRPAKKSAKIKERWKMSATKALLLWAKEQCSLHGSVSITDFKSSWRSGLAFLAIIQTLRPGLVDLEKAKVRTNKENLKEAFKIAEVELNIPRLLEPEDVDVVNPDEKSIMTYVAQFLQYSKNLPESEEDMQEKVRQAMGWLAAQEKKLAKLLVETENEAYYQKYKEMMSFMETFNQEKIPFMPVLSSKRGEAELSEGQQQMREEWDKVVAQINEWKVKLDQMLPSPLDSIEAWLQEVERLQAEDLPDLQDPFKAMSVFREIIVIFKSHHNKKNVYIHIILFSNIRSTNPSTFLEYHYGLCSAIANEVKLKLNIWDVKYGAKESVESLLENWNVSFRDTLSHPDGDSFPAGDPQEINKLLKTVESKISTCKEYISNVNTTLQKVLSSWSNYTENIHLLKTWLEENRNEDPKEIPAEILAKRNSIHGSLNEAGNYLIEVSKEQVGSNIAKELKKLNRRWAKFIKKTHFVSYKLLLLFAMQPSKPYFLDLPLGEESTNAAEKTTDLPGSLEKIEELLGGVDSWAAEMGRLLSKISHQEPVEPKMEEHLQSLAARGSSCQDQVVAAEEILQSLMQNVSSQVFQQHSCTTGLEARIKEARDKVEVLVYKHTGNSTFKKEALLHFEESQKELEASISKAVQLVSQKLNPEECISRYEVGLCSELAVRQEIVSYVQLMVEREKKKFNATFKKINKQLGKEKKLLSMDKTKGLIKEHEAFFSHEGSMKELNKSLEDLKALSRLSEETVPGIQTLTSDCEKRLEKVQQMVADTYTALLARVGKGQSPQKGWVAQSWLIHIAFLINQRKTHLTSGGGSVKQLYYFGGFLCLKILSVFSCLLPQFMFCYLSCRINSLRTALEIVLPTENESILLCELDQRLKKKDIQQFNLMNSDLAYRELKELQRSILNQIEVCKQLEHLDSSARDEFNPIDLQAASKIMIYYQNQLEEMSHKMQIRETVLKDLEAFMASLRKIQSSIKCLSDPPDQPEVRGKALREAAQEVSHMAEEAKCLDERLKTVDICLEDAECGRRTCCENLVLTLSEELNVIYDPPSEQVLTEEKDLCKTFSRKNGELLKNIQDLRDRINKIGLKDPTIPAIQKRIKSLTELEKELDRAAAEMKPMQEIANKLRQIDEEKAEETNEQCRVTERLWEDTKLLLAECQEQCARVLELLKQYQSCKTSLTSIIQKQELVLSQQTSYMGKENLNRLIAKIEEAKEEFNDHSEDVDKINQICKNLQFQLNKMRSFEEPPFENEANIIVDRWLDINEKTENYCDNLGRAQALWDKLLSLSGTIDAWANAELKNAEDHYLTEEDLTQLKACLRVQEQKLQKFDNTVAEIEELLNSNEPPLELQVIRSSVVQKMELIKELLSAKRGTSELTVNTAELKGDLDLAKTQIGMTESLLKALSPSDTLEIFTKLEEIHQKILQQEHLVALLQEETDCPDVDELNKQLKCVTDLFNNKKHVLQDHFMGVLNRQCKNFNDWFSSTQLSLKDCFEPSETKPILEERLQRLKHFLTSEGRDRDIQEVKALLNKVKPYLPKASINHLNSRVRDQEAELQRLISKCQKREKELGASLQQLSSLEESSMALEEWLSAQEEKVKEINKDDTELENVYKTLLMQRKPFDSLAQLSNSLREAGLAEYETLSEASSLISRYHALITRVSEMAGNTERLPVEGQNFEGLAQDVSCWIKKLEEALNKMSSQGSELPSDERIIQIKEITNLRDEGEAKIQSMVALGETILRNEENKKPEVQQTISELQKKWENICQMATEFSSPQEQLQCNREQYDQSKEDLKQALMELEKQQKEIFALQPGLEEKQAQLANYADLLQKTEALTSQFSKLKSQKEHLQGHTVDPCFTEAEWSELKHQHENLLSQLQVGTFTLSVLCCWLHFSLLRCGVIQVGRLWVKLGVEELKSQEQQGPLSRCEDSVKKSLVLTETVKQNTSSPEQDFIKDEIETLQSEHKNLEERLENVKQKKENIFSEALELKDEFDNETQKEDKADTVLKRETQITSDTQISGREAPTAVELKKPLEMSDVSLFVDSNNNGKLAKETSQMSHVYCILNFTEIKGPMNNTVLLEKIKACIESLRKERDVLNKLQSQQEVLSQHLTCMDKVLTESQMRQLEHWWQHMEQAVQKKHDQVVAEIDEFHLLMNKARDIQRLIQEQYLQAELHSSAAGKAKDPLIWTTELQDIKHGLSLLKRRIELQMKRIWSDQEKVALENSIQDLQSKLEALSAQQTPQEDTQTTGPALMKHEMMKRLKENISWVKDSLSHLDQKAALFPSDVKSQIRNCQLMNTDILNREPVIVSLDYGLQHVLPSLEPEEVSDMTFLLQTLKNSYKALVLKSAQRLQHLELQLEERQRLTAEIDKVHSQLCKAELMARPDPQQTSTCSELEGQQAILKEMLKDIQEIEGLISSYHKESQVTAGQLSLSEQLFLSDQLRSLKNRARKTQRQIQSKLHEVEQKAAVSREFAEGIASLQQDLDDLQDGEMNLKDDELVGAKQGLKDKCKALKEKVFAFQSNLSQVMKYQEIFECVGLKWDSLQLDELQTKFCKIKNKIKGKIIHLENIVREWDKIQGLLNEIQTVTSSVRKEANILNDSSSSSPAENVISAQILLQAVQQILYLTQEAANQINKNEIFDTSFKESKRKEIKSLEKNVEELKEFLQNLVSGLQSVNKEGSQNEVQNICHIIKHIQLELQQPLVIDLNTMQDEKLRWEAIQNMMEGKFSALKCIMEKEREKEEEKSPAAAAEVETLQGHEAQLKADIAARVVSIFNENEVLTYAAAELCSSVEICQTPHWKEEEFNSAKADLENLHSKLKNLVKPEDKVCLENALRDLVEKSLALRKKAQRKEADEQRYFEKNKSYTETKDKVCDNLKKLEKMLRQSLSRIPLSYKEALEHLEESKILVSSIDSAEEDLMKLRQISGEMLRLCRGSDRALGRIVKVLWENWLGLLEAAKGLEITCEELKQEWKFINEELEREAIILDKLQEEQPESLKEKEKATREELVELLDFVNSFEENINQQQLLLLLLLHRIRNILNTPENAEGEAALPALCEIKAMQERCKKLYKKAQDHKDSVKAEIQERNKVTEEISAVTNALQNAASVLLQDADGKAEQLEELQSVIGRESQALEDIMEKLRIKYSEMYTIVPAEIETQLEDCKKLLQDLEEKVSSEILQNSPQYVLKRKAETINNGLQAIEKMLQQKSENIGKAKEVQKQIWDMLDLWHYKLNELDAEVQDIVEQNSCQAQELMDILVAPLQQYQQVSQRAERRTAILNKATNKMEEYEEHLKNVKDWIESTNSLLRADAQHDSAKSLHKHTDELQMALEDSEQKQNLLQGIFMELEELSPVFETESVMQQLNEMDVQVATLQHEIAEILPQILHVADVSLGDPKVILEHVGPMQKTIVRIQSYEDALQVPGLKMQPFSVFQRARQLLRELKKLEKITKEQNELLEVRLSEIEQKVLSLLEDCGDSADYQQKTEALSLKLKEVKRNLENVQMMLQDKYSEEQVNHMNVVQAQSSFQIITVHIIAHAILCAQDLKLKAAEQKSLIDFIESCVEKMQPQLEDSVTPQSESRYRITQSVTRLNDVKVTENWLAFTQDNVAEEVSSNLDRKLFELLLAISRCLNNMEEMLNTSVLSTEEAAVQQALYETLSVELQKLHADLSDKKDDLLKSISCAGGSTDVFCECFNNLQARLEQTQAATASRSSSMKAGLDHNSNYLVLHCQMHTLFFTAPVRLVSVNAKLCHVLSMLPITLIQEAYKLEVRAQYQFTQLNSPSISESQYEDLLHGFAELVAIGREKMAQDPKHLTKSRAALQSHLKNHKVGDFFCNLMTRMAYMEAFSKRVTPSVLQKREEFWRELVNEVKLLEKKACQYGIHLESLLKDWMVFDEECLVFNKELEALASALPSVSLVEETEERLLERIALLEKIKSSVDEKHAKLYQMVKEGKKLLTAVSCPEIRSQIGKLEEQWLSLTKKVGHELHRLQTLLKLLLDMFLCFVSSCSYNRDSEELMKWLDSAQQRMNFWKEQSLNVSQDLATIRDNISSLFTFSKEVDEKSSLKSSVVSTASQLLHVKQADTAALRSSLAKFEQKWGELITQLPAIQEKLHQLQMEKLSSREAIAELMAWLDHVEQQQEREEPINSQHGAAQVKTLLQKYKEYMMEMNFKQWMVDFVNQSLLQMSTCDVESKRYERTEFAECLGEMNLRWHRLQASLNRKIQDLEHILEDITENENKAQTLYNWLEAQSDRLRSLQTPASLISAQNTLDDCKELENQLTAKSKALDELKESLASNGSAEQAPEAQSLRIAELCEMKDSIVNQVAQLKASMESVLEQWRAYDEIYAEVNLMTTRYLYCIDQCKPSGEETSLEALKKQVKTLQALQDESENSEESWAKLQAAASNLKKNCSPSFAEIIDQKCTEAHTRWNSVNEDITDQLRAAQAALQLWEPFDALCTETAAKLQQYSQQCAQLLDARVPEENTIETLEQRIQEMKNLQHGLQNIAGCRTQIYLQADRIKQQAGTAAEAVLLEKLQPFQRATYLEKMLQRKLDELQNQTLELAALSPSIESLNEASIKLPLSDFTLKKMQSLTRQWSQKTAAALECCSMLEGTQNDEKKFFQKCEKWMKFLEKMKEALKTDIPGNFEELQEQQRVYEVKLTLKMEAFISKLTLLKEQWQNVIRMVQQRKKDIDGLVSQWQLFRSSLQSLNRFLDDTNSFLTAVKSQDCYSLYQLRNVIHDFKVLILTFYTSLVLSEQTCDRFEKQTKELESRLQELKEKIKDPLPVEHEELHKAKEHIKVSLRKQEIEDRLNAWIVFNEKNKELCSWLVQMESKVLQTADVSIEDMIDKLQKVNMRVLHANVETSAKHDFASHTWEKKHIFLFRYHCFVCPIIKAMFVYVHQDCMEEINLFSENKLHLKQMGDQLIKASNKSRVAEIDDKLNKINDRWQHLFDVIGSRDPLTLCGGWREWYRGCASTAVLQKRLEHCTSAATSATCAKSFCFGTASLLGENQRNGGDASGKECQRAWRKLKETFAFIQLLDKNMSNLRTWLARIESELSKPVVYDICDDQEIQKRLAEQQDLQRDIEQHTAGVESVFNICEVLLHDSDACANETECDSIQQTTRSLDRRWRNICAMSMERRMKIEETWRLWQRFLDDYSRFEDWLKASENIAARPNSSEVLYTHAKEELKKFERQIHERLTQLELINKQYRRLARENRTDSASKLKQMVHEGNQRWDNLQKRVASILRRLKHFTNRRDEFEGTRESILVWLTEMDLQLTNVEHFSKSNFDDKMRQLNGFQQEITLNTNKIDQLIVFGEQLIQKSEPLDAILIEDELEELHRYCQEGLDDEKDNSENETDQEDSREIQNDPWHKKAITEGPSSTQSLCHLMPPTQGHERSGCETPVSVDSIPLEWDHTGDVGGSSSHEDDEEATYYSALSGKSVSEAHPWHSPGSPVCRKHRYNQAEMVGNVLSGPETSTPYKPDYVTGSLDFLGPHSSFQVWELIQAQDLRNKLRMKQKLQQWQQLDSDLSDISAWLDKTEQELEELQKVKHPTSMQALEQKVKTLKDMLKAFDNYKAVLLSANLSSKEFQKADSTEFKELQNRLRKVNLHWEKATRALDTWRKGLQQALLHCQDFHDQSQKLILWLASAESRRNEAQITDPNADLNTILECQKELMQLEKELLEQQLNVNSLQELTAYLLLKSDGDYIEEEEKVHVIGTKLKQLIEQVSHDLKTIQGNLVRRLQLHPGQQLRPLLLPHAALHQRAPPDLGHPAVTPKRSWVVLFSPMLLQHQSSSEIHISKCIS